MKKFWSLYSLCAILVILVTRSGIGQEMIGMGWYHPTPYPHRGENRKWGYINSSGIQVVHPQYDLAGPFQKGLASVKKGNNWGYINDKGTEVIPLEFEVAAPFAEGLAAVKKDGKWGYINTEGSKAIDFLHDMADSKTIEWGMYFRVAEIIGPPTPGVSQSNSHNSTFAILPSFNKPKSTRCRSQACIESQNASMHEIGCFEKSRELLVI